MTPGNRSSRSLSAVAILFALFISLLEIAARVATTHETFHARQIGLGWVTNFAALATLGLVLRLLLMPFGLWSRNGQTKSGAAHALGGFILAGCMLAVSDAGGLGTFLRGAPKLVAMTAVAIVLAMVAGRFARGVLLTRTVILAWLVSVALSGYAGLRTIRSLAPWVGPAQTAKTDTARERVNVLLIVLDTLRFDRVDIENSSGLTPHLARLAQESYVYENAMSTAPWTLPMHASLFTGLYPREHRVSWGNYELADESPTLAELLAQNGYSTVAISNNWLLNRQNGFAKGFQEFLETPNDAHIGVWRLAMQCKVARTLCGLFGLSVGLGDDAGSAWTNLLFKMWLQGEARSSRPFFAFLNYFEPHDPYHPPQQYVAAQLSAAQQDEYRQFRQRQDDLCAHACGRRDTFTAAQIKLMAALYDAEVAYQDAMLGDLLDSMRQMGLFETTWIVITSDHGELFGENDMVFHTAGAHYQLLHVPLIVRPPGGVAHKVVDSPVQPVDVFHTLVEIGGGKLPADVTRSHSLPMGTGDSASRTICVSESFGASITGLYVAQYRDMQTDVTGWMHWITSVYAAGYLLELHDEKPVGFFHVETDPRMERNLIGERPDLVEEYVRKARRWADRPGPGEHASCYFD